MNDHNKRLLHQICSSIEQYKNGKIDPHGLLLNLTGNCGAIEHKGLQKYLDRTINEIEDALWSFDEEEGMHIINSKLESLKEMIEPLESEIIHKNDILIVYELVEAPYSWNKSPFNHEEFACLLVVNDNNIGNETQNYISDKLINYGCKYAVCTGHNCSTWDDSIDWSYLAKHNFEPNDDDLVMTTWHENDSVDDIVFFFMKNTNFDNHYLKNYLILFIGCNEILKKEIITEVNRNILLDK